MSDSTSCAANFSFKMSVRGKTFAFAAMFLPTKVRDGLTRLYAFCRYIDDVADDPNSAEDRKGVLNRVMEDIRSGHSANVLVTDFLKLMAEFGIPIILPEELIKGVISDLELVRFKDIPSLLSYCYAVASTVGLMICFILGVKSSKAFGHAADLGIAMQLTNICRDVKEDFQCNRIYLPESLCSANEVKAALENDSVHTGKVASAVAVLLSLSELYYESGNAGVALLPESVRLGIMVASHGYRGIGLEIAKRPERALEERVVLGAGPKLLAAMSATIDAVKIGFDRLNDDGADALALQDRLTTGKSFALSKCYEVV